MLIGSNALNLKYLTDYDLQEHVHIKQLSDYIYILKKLREIVNVVQQTKDIYLMDIKAGSFNTLPVRWNYDDVMNGYQIIDNVKEITLFDALQDVDSKVKIDLIVKIDNEFVEFSCNYYFGESKYKQNDISLGLLINIKSLFHENKLMKMLKRIMSYRLINKLHIDDFIVLFNSKAGLLYQIVHKLTVILDVYELVEDFNEIIYAVNNIYKIIPGDYKQYMKIVNKRNIKTVCESMIKAINEELDHLVVKFVNS